MKDQYSALNDRFFGTILSGSTFLLLSDVYTKNRLCGTNSIMQDLSLSLGSTISRHVTFDILNFSSKLGKLLLLQKQIQEMQRIKS